MQRVLEQMAKKLNAYDEASLMQLWHAYATRVRDFEPTQRWEEAALALCLIQAVHWKNQLFNYNLALSNSPADLQNLPPLPDFFTNRKKTPAKGRKAEEDEEKRPRATLLHFPPRQGQAPAPEQIGKNDREKGGDEERNQAPDAAPALSGPDAAPALSGPDAAPALSGPDAAPALSGPDATGQAEDKS